MGYFILFACPSIGFGKRFSLYNTIIDHRSDILNTKKGKENIRWSIHETPPISSLSDRCYTLSEARSGVNWADLMAAQGAFGTDFSDRSTRTIVGTMLWTEYRPVIQIGAKDALGSHEIRPIHSAQSLGQSIGTLNGQAWCVCSPVFPTAIGRSVSLQASDFSVAQGSPKHRTPHEAGRDVP